MRNHCIDSEEKILTDFFFFFFSFLGCKSFCNCIMMMGLMIFVFHLCCIRRVYISMLGWSNAVGDKKIVGFLSDFLVLFFFLSKKFDRAIDCICICRLFSFF